MFISYPAIFYKNLDEEGYTVNFPDLPGCITCGDTENETIQMAQDALCCYLYEYFINGENFPKASNAYQVSIKLDEDDKEYYTLDGSFISLVGADMTEYVKRTEDKVVRKSLTIPSYLNELGKSKNVNFSQILTDALKAEFDID